MLNARTHLFGLALLSLLSLGVWAAPLDLEDPELTAGYFQGDMDIEFTRNGEIASTRHWPNATVPYKIDEEFTEPYVAYIELGMRLIERVSCVRFVPATAQTLDYVFVTVSSSGCSSKVGYRGGEQTVKLKPAALDTGCFKLGTIQHELLHTLGFHHQQCAADRDEFVHILEENIQEGKEGNFLKYEVDRVSDFDVAYDYGSILHYSSKAFSVNGQPTIVALKPEGQLQMGQRLALSEADIKRLNTMYKCPLPL
ncbi:CG7631 [Drosophila busckii]|uniref:Metalloendopeptidase n=1 Tax=Drosophila busckii TaxID=30019 RepID=A0A0M4EB81_DROBS|nr:seminal metalloprotease 1 [Drosophila busckii]ALC39801.1 CG7631 [Drosophila busckii]